MAASHVKDKVAVQAAACLHHMFKLIMIDAIRDFIIINMIYFTTVCAILGAMSCS